MKHRQVNIRLADEDVSVLEAAAFLNGGSLGELARAVLLQEVEALRKQPRIRNAITLRAEQAAEASGKLSSLEIRRQRGPSEAPSA